MSGASRNGWIVATSIGAVEALKDQLGVCRWNYGLRLIHQNVKKTVRVYYQTHLVPTNHNSSSDSDSSLSSGNKMISLGKKIEKREKGLKKVMDLSCWGPTTSRF